MKLSKLELKNFRSCKATEVQFASDLTVLVGENASGKSAVIDALRIVTTSAIEQSRLAYSPVHDPSQGSLSDAKVQISTTFDELTEGQQATFLTQLVDEDDALRYNADFSRDVDIPYWKVASRSVGLLRVEDAEPANGKLMSHIYLPPMRDAVRELDSGDGHRLSEVLKVLTSSESDRPQRTEFIDDANALVDQISGLTLPSRARGEIDNHLSQITPPSRRHGVRFDGRRHELRRLAGLMRIQLSDAQIDPLRLASSGLGYANLLYIATIVLQLANAKDYELSILLVEEPEAHLHPELQSVLLEYLRKQAFESHSPDSPVTLQPEGRVQVVVTTHSPNLASSVSVENIVVVSREDDIGRQRDGIESELDDKAPVENEQDSGGSSWGTKATSIANLGLDASAIRKIDRYLSVTRASLLFARYIVLVEGIAESILLPVIANKSIYPGDPDALRHLKSAAFVAIDGVDFEPYLHLLLDGDFVRVDHVAVITDGDPTAAAGLQGEARKLKYEKAFAAHVHAGRLSIHHGQTTLEADLFGLSKNEELLKSSYLAIHPQSESKWDDLFSEVGEDASERAAAFASEIRTKTGGLELGKGEFAQLVSEAISAGSDIAVPSYINSAIRTIVESWRPLADGPDDL